MTHDEMVSVIQAHADGKTIEYQHTWHANNWTITSEPCWDFARYNYRVRTKLVEHWVNIYPSGMCGGTYGTESEAKQRAEKDAVRVAVHMREVI